MDEAAAKRWLVESLDVSRETMDRLEALVAMLRDENTRQNLVSTASLDQVWTRHIVDSAQLVRAANGWPGAWMDLGSGGGLPGLVLGILMPFTQVILVESRRLRWEWLKRASEALSLGHVDVEPLPVDRLGGYRAGVITARAFAPLPRLLSMAYRFSTEETLWLLPKGRSAADELASVADKWHYDAHMEPSVTDPHAAIIVARNVRHVPPRGRR